MANAAVASGLMPHQKDEHDIWTCKDCGWKYPNARPSPKIRKNHKKHCPGKAGAHANTLGGSSDDASDDDHHHPSVQGGAPPNEAALEAPVPQLESKSRDFDFSSASVNSSTAPVETGNGNAKQAPVSEDTPAPAAVPVAESHGGLMPHQKDEHDIWICKECGWKYPNARPSPKIRKNHKKHCPGKGGPVVAGGSSDEASDDEHHHAIPTPAAAVTPAHQESESTASAAPKAPANISREIDFAALKGSPSPVINNDTPTAALEPDAVKGTGDVKATFPPPSEPVGKENAARDEATVSKPVAHEDAVASGLMLHQKDEDDIWTCKDCGWKYPNARPSPKIRKNHKKKCTGKTSGAAAATGGSSDEASDDEHHLHSPTSAAPVALPPAVEAGKEETAAAPEVPGNISREIDFSALKESSNVAAENVTTSASNLETTPAIAEAGTLAEERGKSTRSEDSGAVSLKEAIDKETGKEKEASSGLMPHQKDEADIWVCKDCGWKYPNAKPSPKIRKNHKKKCSQKAGSAAPGGSSDEASDDEHHSAAGETHAVKDVKASSPAAETVPEVPDAQIQSREFSFSSALPTSDVSTPAEKEQPAKVAETQQAPATTLGGLMAHQKDENDIWQCKDCGWKYPNAKPSPKVRKSHKKKCPKKGGAAKGADGGSSDGASSDDHVQVKGGKCFACL